MNYFTGELYHHGIKGQKWGVQNGPPYPLSFAAKSKSEKQADTSGKLGSPLIIPAIYTAVIAIEIGGAYVSAKLQDRAAYNRAKKYYEEHSDEIDKFVETEADVKAPDEKYYLKTNKYNTYMKERENEKIDKKTGLHVKTNEMSADDDMRATNPEYNSNFYAKMNCGLCTMAYDIRRRGYDVVAGYSVSGMTPQNIVSKYKGAKREDIFGNYGKSSVRYDKALTKNEAKESINKISQTKGSRGALFVIWARRGSGHCMAYEVTEDGKFIIRDAQSGKSYQGQKAINILTSSSYVGTVRLDNLQPDYKVMKKEGIIK